MFGSPLVLKLGGGEIAESRVNAFVRIDVVEEAADLAIGVVEIGVVGEIDLFLFNGAIGLPLCG